MSSDQYLADYIKYGELEEKYRQIALDVEDCLNKIYKKTDSFETLSKIFEVMRDSKNQDPSNGKFEETYSDGMTTLVSDYNVMVLKMKSGIAQLETKFSAAKSLVTYYQNAKMQAYRDYQEALEDERREAEEAAEAAALAAAQEANTPKAV